MKLKAWINEEMSLRGVLGFLKTANTKKPGYVQPEA